MPKDKSGKKAGSEERISIKAEWLDEVMKEYRGPQDFEAIFKGFKKAVVELRLSLVPMFMLMRTTNLVLT